LPPHLKAQIDRELDCLEMVIEQIKAMADEFRHAIVTADTVTSVPRMLIELKGIGNEFATVPWTECLYRRFDNRRQVLYTPTFKVPRSASDRMPAKRTVRVTFSEDRPVGTWLLGREIVDWSS
jgi:hypothetical protein